MVTHDKEMIRKDVENGKEAHIKEKNFRQQSCIATIIFGLFGVWFGWDLRKDGHLTNQATSQTRIHQLAWGTLEVVVGVQGEDVTLSDDIDSDVMDKPGVHMVGPLKKDLGD